MSTTTSLIENVIAYLTTQLATISIANSYRTDVKEVGRVLKAINEIDPTAFPCLYLVFGEEDIRKQTNREIESVFSLVIFGYAYFNESKNPNSTAQQEMLKLMADVKEKLYALNNSDFDGNVEKFDINRIMTTEGEIEPHEAFRMECNLQITTAYSDMGRKVQ